MTAIHDIRYLRTAEEDLEGIFEYIRKDNPAAAMSLLDKFDKSISQLAENPYLGVIPKERRLKYLRYRMLIIDKNLVFYVVKCVSFKYVESFTVHAVIAFCSKSIYSKQSPFTISPTAASTNISRPYPKSFWVFFHVWIEIMP
jgi:toxin ParE1/3/4